MLNYQIFHKLKNVHYSCSAHLKFWISSKTPKGNACIYCILMDLLPNKGKHLKRSHHDYVINRRLYVSVFLAYSQRSVMVGECIQGTISSVSDRKNSGGFIMPCSWKWRQHPNCFSQYPILFLPGCSYRLGYETIPMVETSYIPQGRIPWGQRPSEISM